MKKPQKRTTKKARDKITASRRRDDPFFVHPDDVPEGKVWQWFSLKIKGIPVDPATLESAASEGWRPVRRGRKKVVVKDNLLMQNTKAFVDAQLDLVRNNGQVLDATTSVRMANDHMVSTDFLVSGNYQQVPADAPDIVVNVTIRVKIKPSWQNAAAMLGLTPTEYTRRRLIQGKTPLMVDRMAYLPWDDTPPLYEPGELEFREI